MSHDPKKKQTLNRRLAIETMETRLMLSISPTGPGNLRDLVDVELVSSSMQGATPIDLLDFRSIAAQFHDAYLSAQINQIVPLPEFPNEGEGSLTLRNPTTFLRSPTGQAIPVLPNLAARLSDELTSLDWSTSAEDGHFIKITPVSGAGVGQDADMTYGGSGSVLLESDSTKSDSPLSNPDVTLQMNLRSISDLHGEYPLGIEDGFRRDGMVAIEGSFLASYGASNVVLIAPPVYSAMANLDFEGGFIGDFAYAFNADSDANSGHLGLALVVETGGLWTFTPDNPGNPREVAVPPSPSTPNIQATLRATADAFYQERFDGNNPYTNSSSNPDKQTVVTIYGSPQTALLAQQNTNLEGETDEEGSLLGLLGSRDGATELETVEIEGFMNTDPEVLLVDTETNAGEEGGMIDFTAAMSWSEKPVVATAEGIVQAGTQQDDKVAFEGSYGRGQTFELATAVEAAPTTEDPTLKDISAALIEELNKTPLNNNATENLDKTDSTPTTHERALGQVASELDYASLLPSDALSWATFAFVGQHATRQPNDQKKKKEQT